jgi:AraC-like DNA-binding protein
MTPPFSLPISFMTALIALALLIVVLRSQAGSRASRTCFGLLFGLIFAQAVLVGIRFGYGLEAVAPYQRVLPFGIGPLAYLGFRAMTDRGVLRAALPHAAAALLAVAVCWWSTLAFNLIDPLIGLSFATYIALLAGLYRRGPDLFAATPFDAIPRTRAWLLATLLFLSAVLAIDSAIALDFSFFDGRLAPALIGLGNAVLIPFLLAAAILYPRRGAHQASGTPDEPARPADPQADQALLDRLDALLAGRHLYRDPDLSLARLARRLGLPARRVSEASNRVHGLNVSQFVNNHRVAEAARLLATTRQPVG